MGNPFDKLRSENAHDKNWRFEDGESSYDLALLFSFTKIIMLTIVGTPIGNMGDFSPRGARSLLEADLILAEDTRSATRMLEHSEKFIGGVRNENQRVVSYHKDNEYQKLESAIDSIESGLSVVLISEAGMPILSDPGNLLVKTCRKRGLQVTVVPGPSSLDSALVLSGMAEKNVTFTGFLPKKENDLKKHLAKLSEISKILKGDVVFVAFESPERINETLKFFYGLYPKSEIGMAREITKQFEEFLTMPDPDKVYKGEIVVIMRFV